MSENKQAAGLDLEVLRHRYRLDGRAYDADVLALVDRIQALEGERDTFAEAHETVMSRCASLTTRAETAEAAISEQGEG